MNKIFRKAIVLTLAGSALLYTGCTKDYSGDITTLQKEVAELQKTTSESISGLRTQVGKLEQAVAALEKAKQENDEAIKKLQTRVAALETFQDDASKELATLKQNITDLQTVDQALAAALAAAKERIEALENNTYTKTEVDGKIESVKEWAMQTFATKATVQLIDNKLGEVSGIVDGILKTLDEVDGELQDIWTALGNVKTTAEQALENANSALTGVNEIKQDLIDHYYTSEKVNALLKTLENNLQAQIDAEIAAREAGDAAAQTRIDSLAKVTKAIEDDLDDYKKAVDKHFEEVENLINEEVQNRMIADALLKQEIADTAAAIRGFVKEIEAALDVRITTNANNIADLQDKYTELRSDLNLLAANVLLLDIYTKYLDAQMKAYAERVQSVVFVPRYDDLKADLVRFFIRQNADEGQNYQNIVVADFEVKPTEAIAWVDSIYKANKLGVAFKSVDSRALYYDDITYDVEVFFDEEKGRFTVNAFLGPDVEDDIVISCTLGDFEVEGLASGNAIQSTYVGVYDDERNNRYLDGSNFVWYDTEEEEPIGIETEEGDSLGVSVRIAYTAPAEDSLVFHAISENIDIFLKIEDSYLSIAGFEESLHLPAGTLEPVGYVAKFVTKDKEGHIIDGNDPFEFAEDAYCCETSLTTKTNDEGIVDPMYVGYNNVRKEGFTVLGVDIAPYAFVGTVITKNQVPAFTVEPYEIPWSYVHYAEIPLQTGKSFEVDGSTDFGKAINGVWDNSDENFTKDGSAYTPELTEWLNFIPANDPAAGMVRFFGWVFEADSAKYVAKTERFETDSDEYTVDVPFTVCPRAKDRDVIISMGELDYTPTYGLAPTFIQDNSSNALPGAIAPAFNGDEDLFIGDAEEFAAGYGCVDSLYSAYANQGSAYHCFNSQAFGDPTTTSFNIDSVRVNGVIDEFAIDYITVILAYNTEESVDVSTIEIEPGYLPYGAEVTVYGRYNQFNVNFYYEITFKTPACPFYLVLTPYGDFDPAKSKTIIVEGDDHYDAEGNPTSDDDARRYNIQQMYYTKYMRVQDQDGVPTNLGEDLEVRLLFEYEDFAEFGIELTPDSTPDDIQAAEQMRGTFSGVTDVVDVLSDDLAGYLDQQAILTWGTYQGRKVKVYATLYDNDVCVSEALEFYIETMKPIELVQPLYIGSETDPLIRISGDPVDIKPASAMIVGGILSRDADYKPYYVADPSVFGYNDNNVRQQGIRVNEGSWFSPRYVYYPAGQFHPFYGPMDNNGEGRIVSELIFDYDNIHAILNDTEWDLKNGGDWTVIFDDYGETFRLIKDSGKGNIILNIPVKFRYYLDYCGAKAQEGIVTVYIKQI